MQTDRPISEAHNDQLNRTTFVIALAEQIVKIKENDCYVIGLYGQWGSGKTSILGLLEKELQRRYHFTAYFNPWRYKSEDILLKELFLKILEGARTDKKLQSKVNKLGTLLDEYSQYIAVPKISVGGLALDFSSTLRGFGKGLGRLLKGNDSFDKKKKQINEVLNDLAVPLVIFIDDIDRLDAQEVHALFKLIKLTADFNKLIYVIALDDDMVSKALAKNYGAGEYSDGKGFLEKIVQLPLRIPLVTNFERFEYTLKLLNAWSDQNGFEFPEKYQPNFVKHFQEVHDIFIKTPRDSKRLVNSVSFSMECLKNEICPYDIILLETFRIFLPGVFEQLINFRQHLFSKPASKNGYAVTAKQTDLGKLFQERISSYAFANTAISKTIDFLFPSNEICNVGFNTYHGETTEDLFTNQRVGIKKYFDRFIEFKIGKNDISDAEFKGILSNLNSKPITETESEIERLSAFSQHTILSLFQNFASQLSDQGKINVAIILCTRKNFYDDNSLGARFLHIPTMFSFDLLAQLEEKKRTKALSAIIAACDSVLHAAFILHDGSFSGKDKDKPRFTPQNALDEIATKFIAEAQKKPIASYFYDVDNYKCDVLFHLIHKYGDSMALDEKLLVFCKESEDNVLTFMKSLIPMSYINFSSVGQYSNRISKEVFDRIEEYVPRETLLEMCRLKYPANDEDLEINMSEERTFPVDKLIAFQYMRYTQKFPKSTITNDTVNDEHLP